ncbi:MAG: DUF72 domain-containing protein, partial [candidate division KSB1 bacterium]|nr:DUF72 domain-containing protein [candidate division KSB1 bacterium]
MPQGNVYIGTSGWNYRHWEGRFYPQGLKQKNWFNYYARYFNTVEINNTFYHLPQKEVFENWNRSSPDHFLFVVKASRFITHMKKLKDPQESTRNFLENASGLGSKIGPVLFQLPPFWNLDLERLKSFAHYITHQQIIPDLKVALELRNPTWVQQEVFEVLQNYNLALCFADWPELPIEEPVTADFIYLRRHGPSSLYASCYSQQQLWQDAEKIIDWRNQGKDVFVYYNNDAQAWAVENALTLMQMVEDH